MIFTDESKFGQNDVDYKNSVLLFCYFNNEMAFLNYVDEFKGNRFIGKYYNEQNKIFILK